MEAKKTLGRDIVTFYHGAEAAAAAQAEWERRFSRKARPDGHPRGRCPGREPRPTAGWSASKLLVALGLATSNNEARRLVQGGGVTVGPERTKSPTATPPSRSRRG